MHRDACTNDFLIYQIAFAAYKPPQVLRSAWLAGWLGDTSATAQAGWAVELMSASVSTVGCLVSLAWPAHVWVKTVRALSAAGTPHSLGC